jgi:hypothetical protein
MGAGALARGAVRRYGHECRSNCGPRELHDASGQYDHLACIPCTYFSASRPGRTLATWRRCGQFARCSSRVVRSTRHARVGTLKSCGPLSEDLNPQIIRSSSAPTISLQDLAPGTEFLRPETKRLSRPFSLPRDRVAHIIRHTTPANAAFSREVSENAKLRECVVAEAVERNQSPSQEQGIF